ncbi:hypothetical protein [Leifsonia poae]|uniref:hypothetical protein n=1 Tax=Leifsonia poae TaxID=110933 RepID=UPI003D66F7ED
MNKAQGKTDSAAVQKFKSWVSDAQEIRSWAGEADDLERALQQAIRAHLIP